MLVLSRKKREAITVSTLIAIRVVEIKGDKVRLGIEAPRGLGVHREEVHQAIEKAESDDPRAKVIRIQKEIREVGLILDQLRDDQRHAIAVMVAFEAAADDLAAIEAS